MSVKVCEIDYLWLKPYINLELQCFIYAAENELHQILANSFVFRRNLFVCPVFPFCRPVGVPESQPPPAASENHDINVSTTRPVPLFDTEAITSESSADGVVSSHADARFAGLDIPFPVAENVLSNPVAVQELSLPETASEDDRPTDDLSELPSQSQPEESGEEGEVDQDRACTPPNIFYDGDEPAPPPQAENRPDEPVPFVDLSTVSGESGRLHVATGFVTSTLSLFESG